MESSFRFDQDDDDDDDEGSVDDRDDDEGVLMMMMLTMLTMMAQVMEKTLSKLATFDEGSMMGSMLGFVVSITMMMTMMKDRQASISTHKFMPSSEVYLRKFYFYIPEHSSH